MNPVHVIEQCDECGLLPAGTWVVACSGGLDSVCLVQALVAAGFRARLRVATVDHGLHSLSADHCEFVQDLCSRLNVECQVIHLDAEQLMAGANLEATAREHRYAALKRYACQTQSAVILTAHTANDQAETLLMRLSKGAGLTGLRGILRDGHQIVRPWLTVTRNELRAWAKEMGVEWCEDPTNEDTQYMRSRLRRKAIPELSKAFGDSFLRNVNRSAQRLAMTENALNELLRPAISQCVHQLDQGCRIHVPDLSNLSRPIRLEILYRVMNAMLSPTGRVSLNRHELQVSRLDKLVCAPAQGGSADLGFGWTAWRSRDWLEVRLRERLQTENVIIEIDDFGTYSLGDWQVEVSDEGRFTGVDGQSGISGRRHPFPWTFGFVQSSDTYQPFGAPGHRKAMRVLMDSGISAQGRSVCPVIRRQSIVLAMPVVRPSESGRCTVGDQLFGVTFRRV